MNHISRFSVETGEKLIQLKKTLRKMKSLMIAYSGGVDSTFLLKIAQEELGNKNKILAVTACSAIFLPEEMKIAQQITQKLQVKHQIIDTTQLDNPSFFTNPPNRCYYCKKELFSKLSYLAKENGLNFVVDGSNLDDLGDFRPGMQAAKELGIRSPLIEVGLSKEEIRNLSRKMGLPTWNKPSQACLASRFPYGTKITRTALRKVAEAETFLKTLGISQVRVRYYGAWARIEVPVSQISRLVNEKIRSILIEKFKHIGYTYITLDLEGYRQGSMNLDLPIKKASP